MTTQLDLLKTIYNSTISLPIHQKINPEYNKSVVISHYYSSNETYCTLNGKVTYFTYTLNRTTDMKYKYKIELYKTEPSKLLVFTINKERYILRVQISERINYDEIFRNEYFFDSKVIKTSLLNDIFNFLMNRNIELTNLEQSEKFELYVNDLSKSVDKSAMREETLNKILDK